MGVNSGWKIKAESRSENRVGLPDPGATEWGGLCRLTLWAKWAISQGLALKGAPHLLKIKKEGRKKKKKVKKKKEKQQKRGKKGKKEIR